MNYRRLLCCSLLFMLIFPVLIGACKPEYGATENVTISDAIEPSGNESDCTIYIYTNTTIVQSGAMQRNDLAYNYTAGILAKGDYISNIVCNYSNNTFLGECKFIVGTGGVNDTMMAIGIIMLGAIAILAYYSRKAEDSNIRTLLSLSTLFLTTGALFVGYVFANDLGLSESVIKIVFTIDMIMASITLIITFYTIYNLIVEAMYKMHNRKL